MPYTIFIVLLILTLCPTSSRAESDSMVTYNISVPPIGFLDFCKKNRSFCRWSRVTQEKIVFDERNREVISGINAYVNRLISYKTDIQNHGKVERWSIPNCGKGVCYGDCEDYALTKRAMLIAKGYAPENLLLTVVRDVAGEGHAVLTIRTDRGDYVLDNQIDAILIWWKTKHSYIKRQSPKEVSGWVSLKVYKHQ